MRIKFLVDYERRKAGEVTEVLRSKAADLVRRGIAQIHDDQTRDISHLKKPEPEQPPQNITVNNFYMTPEEVEIEDMPDVQQEEFLPKQIKK